MKRKGTDEAPTDEKLQKVLARAGVGSRRAMEKAIAEGRVKVNGKVATLGDRVTAEDKLHVDGRPVRSSAPGRGRVLLYNKPEGEICARSDPQGRRTVFQKLPRLKGERWIAVGRLDYTTSGLLLFTTDGDLAHRLMHPSSEIDREYLCRVMGRIDDDMLKRLKDGVLLDDGEARFTDIQPGRGDEEGLNRWFYVVLMEGRNREVRRLWESQDVQVNRLKRVRFGSIFLPPRLKAGQWEEVGGKDLQEVYRLAGLDEQA